MALGHYGYGLVSQNPHTLREDVFFHLLRRTRGAAPATRSKPLFKETWILELWRSVEAQGPERPSLWAFRVLIPTLRLHGKYIGIGVDPPLAAKMSIGSGP